jgi:rubrerythrin
MQGAGSSAVIRPWVSEIFEDTASQETQHAFSHLSLIYPKDEMTVAWLLEIAIEGERYERTTMYSGFVDLPGLRRQ